MKAYQVHHGAGQHCIDDKVDATLHAQQAWDTEVPNDGLLQFTHLL